MFELATHRGVCNLTRIHVMFRMSTAEVKRMSSQNDTTFLGLFRLRQAVCRACCCDVAAQIQASHVLLLQDSAMAPMSIDFVIHEPQSTDPATS